MKKFLTLTFLSLFSILFWQPCFAQEEVYLAIEDKQPDFKERILNSTKSPEKESEDVILDQEQTLENRQISPIELEVKEEKSFLEKLFPKDEEYIPPKEQPLLGEIGYDIMYEMTPVFSEYTAKEFEKGPIEKFTPFFAYQGQMDFKFMGDNGYHTKYLEPTVELALKGKFRAPIRYTFILNFLPDHEHNYFQTMFKDDFIILDYIPHHEVYLGSFRTPIGVEGGTSGYTLPLINRSQLARNFGSVRAVGTKILGNYSLVDYNIGITSSDRYFEEFFPGVELNSWINFKPLGKTNGKYGILKIGGGINAGHRHFDYLVASTGISYRYKKFGIDAEYGISNGSNGLSGVTENKGQGVNLTLTYSITRRLQAVLRYDYFDKDMEQSGKKATEYSAGLNYYIKGSACKFMLNYIYRTSEYEDNSHRIMLGTQLLL